MDLITDGLGDNGTVSLFVGASNAMCNVDNLLDVGFAVPRVVVITISSTTSARY